MKSKATLEDYKDLCLKWHSLKKENLQKNKVKLLSLFTDIALIERSLRKRYPISEINQIYYNTLEEMEKEEND